METRKRESMIIREKQNLSVKEIGTGLIDHSLPHDAWTHEAHLAAAIYLLAACPGLDARREMPGLIRSYNEKNGVENTDSSGFHATITAFYLDVLEDFIDGLCQDLGPDAIFEKVLASPISKRDYPLNFYTRERLFSKQARAEYFGPDICEKSITEETR